MMKHIKRNKMLVVLLVTFILVSITAGVFMYKKRTQEVSTLEYPQALVNYEHFKELVVEVDAHRKERLVTLSKFMAMSKEENVVILDTRSKEMYDKMHVKGAIHLNFSDFTQSNLAKLIPDRNTRILIYCNNNFADEPIFFAPKASSFRVSNVDLKPVTLALNIPTYINLYGYGYKNVYELSELVYVKDSRIQFEGTAVNNN